MEYLYSVLKNQRSQMVSGYLVGNSIDAACFTCHNLEKLYQIMELKAVEKAEGRSICDCYFC